MGFLARLFGAVSKEGRSGIRLSEADPWRLSPTKEVERFLRALPLLVPENAIAYFEGTGESHVAQLLGQLSIAAPVQVAVGTIWPRPDCYHVPVTVETMEALAGLLERRPAGFFCCHCHVYREHSVLLEWHDAFTDGPMYISRSIGPHLVDQFAGALGSSYVFKPAG